MRRVIIIIGVIAAFGLGFLLRGGGGSATPDLEPGRHATAEPTIWTCSMHPQIKLPKPGKCPICFMDLIPLASSQDEELGPRTLKLSKSAAALADIRTTEVVRGSARTDLALIGRIGYDETLQRTISSWIAGRIDTLFVDFTGDVVKRGEPLVSVYSPALYSAQTELLSSLEAAQQLAASSDPLLRRSATATVASARQRLKLWGLEDRQIAAIEQRGTPADHIRIPSPVAGVVVHKQAIEGKYVQTGAPLYTVADLSRVWLIIDAYESDLPWLRLGQDVDFTVSSLPGRTFNGKIVFIDPVLDSRTRTAEVRVEVPNPDGGLKPGLFADATVSARLDAMGKPTGTLDTEPLVIPASAPLITGKRAVVYVKEPDTEKPTFSGREVVLGPRADDKYIVLSGLREGEMVVTHGAFKLDSALQIQAKPSMMSPGGGPPPAHNHGAMSSMDDKQAAKTPTAPESADESFTAPQAFLGQLGGVLDAYLDVQKALANDDDGAARAAGHTLNTALEAVDMSLLTGQAHLAWMRDLKILNKGAAGLSAATDIEGRRRALLELGPPLWEALERFGYRSDHTVRKFHCPMADDNRGGDWLQLESVTANPFFGAAMPRCGSQTDSLTTTASAAAQR